MNTFTIKRLKFVVLVLIQCMAAMFAIASEPIFLIKTNNVYGYISSDGRIVVNPMYNEATDFSEDVAIVMPTPMTGAIINGRGKLFADIPLYQSIKPFSEGMKGSVLEK